MTREIWIWQNVLSPHMAALAAALCEQGHTVKYIAQQLSDDERSILGWTRPSLGGAELVHCVTPGALAGFAETATHEVEHVFQGLRGNGHLSHAYKVLARKGISFWVLMETLDDRGWKGLMRRAYYRYTLAKWAPHIQGILAIGRTTPVWLEARGMSSERLHPFTYFLPDQKISSADVSHEGPFTVLFVGKLIKRKGVDILLTAIAGVLQEHPNLKLVIAGSGPEEPTLREQADTLQISTSINWLGSRKIDEIPALMATADLFVLPSRFDGWGAVVSEALMAGTPAIATDRSGASEAVQASGVGEIIPSGDSTALREAILAAAKAGSISSEDRITLAHWAAGFGAKLGAEYLATLFGSRTAVAPPWIARKGPGLYDIRGAGEGVVLDE